jgi:hypothetical protein
MISEIKCLSREGIGRISSEGELSPREFGYTPGRPHSTKPPSQVSGEGEEFDWD